MLQWVGGNIYQRAGRTQAALACRTAALALRPKSAPALIAVAEPLWTLGRLTDAEGAYRAAIAADPTNADAYYQLSFMRLQLGDYADSGRCIERALELRDNPDWRPDSLAIRFQQGRASKDELLAALAAESRPLAVATYLYPLVDHPDPKQRDPALVLKLLAEHSGSGEMSDFSWLIETVARIRSQDWPGAQAAIEGHFKIPEALIVTPNAFDFIRSLIYSHLGRDAEARDYYARGMVEWDAQTGGNPAAWEHSDVMRWRREAEAVLPQ